MSSIYPIIDHQKIRAHFEALYKVQHEKGISLETVERLRVQRLIYDVSRPGELLLKVEGTACDALAWIEVNYTLGGKPHRFRAEVINCRCMGVAGAILKLRLPERIGVLNRREHLRHRPPETMPVTLTLTTPTGSLRSCQVRDISSGGVGFAVPVGSISLERGTKIPVRINLPDGPIIPATIIIRHLIPAGTMVRVGAEFVALSSEGRQKICDYVILATLGPDRLSLASQGQLPLVCVIGEGVEAEDMAPLEGPYRLIRHELRADWKRLIQVEPDVLLFCNLGAIPAERFIPKVKALPSLNTAPSVLITDEPDLGTDLDVVMVSSAADTASIIDAMETSITACRREQEPNSLAVAAEAPKSILVLNLQRRISLKTICCIKALKYQPIVFNNQCQFLHCLTEQRPALMVLGAAAVKNLKPFLDELSANPGLADIPRALVVDPPQHIDIDHLSQPVPLSASTFLFFRNLPETELVDKLLALLKSS